MINVASDKKSLLQSAGLWFGLLGGLSAWAVHLNFAYGAQEAVCSAGFRGARIMGLDLFAFIWVVTAVTAAVAAAAIVVAFVLMQRISPQDPYGGRKRFMAFGGMASSSLFLAIILLEAAPALVATSCG